MGVQLLAKQRLEVAPRPRVLKSQAAPPEPSAPLVKAKLLPRDEDESPESPLGYADTSLLADPS